MMERERYWWREREHKKEWDGEESKRGRGVRRRGMGVEVGGVETFLSYLWFHLTKEGSLFGSNYISFLPIVDKASHAMCGKCVCVNVAQAVCCCGDGGLSWTYILKKKFQTFPFIKINFQTRRNADVRRLNESISTSHKWYCAFWTVTPLFTDWLSTWSGKIQMLCCYCGRRVSVCHHSTYFFISII